ncbi:MAG TPA: adenylate/guanylate cyclase domain-containing protein [Burkholderiaceae bacterium]|jgi:class 3 adenylate cyclase|nr:adenylate/guanylate cyclase domain-containing protein [Burkholderiaceae bacterium]
MEKNPVEMSWPELTRARRALVVVDVVESVRLMQAHEADVIDRWRRFVHEVQTQVLPVHGGRLVKSLGDGMLLEFESVPPAVAAALEIQKRIVPYNAGREAEAAMYLRVGAHVAEVVIDELDIYGAGVNLAARLASLAGPGAIVVSAEVRGQLVAGLDAEMEDLGECWLKNLHSPVRATRLGPPASLRGRPWSSPSPGAAETVGIAVLPFGERSIAASVNPLGQLIADDTIAQLSRLPQLRVISRLSTSAFVNRSFPLKVVADSLGVDYVAHGSFSRAGSAVRLHAELVDARSQSVVHSASYGGDEKTLLHGDDPLVDRLVHDICSGVIGVEARRACTLPLPTLSSYTILLGAVSLLHSLSGRDFERSRDMLAYLVERHPNMATPRAWLGLWHVMRVGQGWSPDPPTDAGIARSFVAAALDVDPTHSLSLAVDGLVCAYVHKDLDTASKRYESALRSNPNEALAWLYRSACHAYQERGDLAVADALHAQSLSPLDPLKYYYDNFTSTAMLANGDLNGAIDYGLRSLRANRMHGPTLRILAIAQALAGDLAAAQATVREMLSVEPGFSVTAFRARYPGSGTAQVQRYAQALAEAGLPL